MKKGEIKKQQFLRTAEARFCRDGYEKTSIQDILDDLHTSKGSFYHHFISKEALLEEICKNRAAKTSEQVFLNLNAGMTSLEKLNVLLNGLIPFSGEKLVFLLMLIPVFSGPEGITVRNCYTNELEALYLHPVAEVLREGNEEGIFSCPDPDFSAQTILMLVNRFWLDICRKVFENEENGKRTDPADLMSLTRNCRNAGERLLSAPFGSLTIIRIPELQTLTDQIHLHWKTKKALYNSQA